MLNAQGKVAGLTLVNASNGDVVAQTANGTSLDAEAFNPNLSTNSNQLWALSEVPAYWAVTNIGQVDNKLGSPWFGSMVNPPISDVVALVPTPDGGGYWGIEANGTVNIFGDADYLPTDLNSGTCPLAGATVDPGTGGGFWAFDGCGGVFADGAAKSYGSATGSGLHIVAMAATQDGKGYWLVNQNGTVYQFGDAGSGSFTLCSCTVASAVTDPAGGFWALTTSGAVIGGGNAASLGDESNLHKTDFTKIAATADGSGYWLFEQSSSGAVTVYTFGDATAGPPISGTKTLVATVGDPNM